LSASARHLAVDIGAASGRAVVGEFDGDRLRMREVHRFSNVPSVDRSTMTWDVERLFAEVLGGAAHALRDGPIDGLGIDTWGVDYGLLDAAGRLIGAPYHYRDARTDGMPERVARVVSAPSQYARTGVAQLSINTLYQLCAERDEGSRLQRAAALLMIPDLLHYRLCGVRAMERTNASTTGALGLDGTWARDLLEPLGLSAELFAELVPAGTCLGLANAPAAAAIGLSATAVIVSATHDTASAVAGIPFAPNEGPAAFISCGTWSLLGLELRAPIPTEAARRAGFSNEAGVLGSTRFLRNIMGLWLVQECRRRWAAEGMAADDREFWNAVMSRPATQLVIDVDDAALLHPDDMPRAIADQLRGTGQRAPSDPFELTRAVCEGLALRYRASLGDAERLAGVRVEALHLVGGGANNELLCRLTADACGIPVLAGPSEATSCGNVIIQLIAAGAIADLAQGRDVIRRSVKVARYEPLPDPTLDDRLNRLAALDARARLVTP